MPISALVRSRAKLAAACSNHSREESVDVTVDGRPVCTLAPAEQIEARFADGQGALAQVAGANFYHRLREKFGRLSSMR